MNANQAREITLQKNDANYELQKTHVESYIEEHAKNGEFECRYYGTLRPNVKDYFVNQGFVILQVSDGPNEWATVIKW